MTQRNAMDQRLPDQRILPLRLASSATGSHSFASSMPSFANTATCKFPLHQLNHLKRLVAVAQAKHDRLK